jgi:uncharacterized protein (DUF1800 family)
MRLVANRHSTSEVNFLGTKITGTTPAQDALHIALDRLFYHDNTGPFFARQMIQRLVTSNPTPAYVQRVATVFGNNGSGVRGDLKAVWTAILTDEEARAMPTAGDTLFGKMREPVLRFVQWARVAEVTSDNGEYEIGDLSDPDSMLGQSPLRSPSVFNFFRPGYAPPGVLLDGVQVVSPELQMTHEATAAGYVNYVRQGISFGFGPNGGAPLNRLDIQPDYRAEMALADKPAVLMDQIDAKLMYGTMPAALKTEIANAIATISITDSNPVRVENGKRVRVNAAVFLTMVSPEFLVQK